MAPGPESAQIVHELRKTFTSLPGLDEMFTIHQFVDESFTLAFDPPRQRFRGKNRGNQLVFNKPGVA